MFNVSGDGPFRTIVRIDLSNHSFFLHLWDAFKVSSALSLSLSRHKRCICCLWLYIICLLELKKETEIEPVIQALYINSPSLGVSNPDLISLCCRKNHLPREQCDVSSRFHPGPTKFPDLLFSLYSLIQILRSILNYSEGFFWHPTCLLGFP